MAGDEELRRNVKDAYTSARALYDHLVSRNDVGQVATKLVSDEDVQTELRNVVAKLRSAAGRVQNAHEQEKAAKDPVKAQRKIAEIHARADRQVAEERLKLDKKIAKVNAEDARAAG